MTRSYRATAALLLLTALNIILPENVTSQIAKEPVTRLPTVGGINYDATLFIHVHPSKFLRIFSNGDGSGELRVLNNRMRYDASFNGGIATETIWTDLDKDISVQVRHAPGQDPSPSSNESFFFSLGRVPVTKIGEKKYEGTIVIDGKPYKNPLVTDYSIDHQMITNDRAFNGHVLMLKLGNGEIPLLISGDQKRVQDDDCGGYRPFIVRIDSLKTVLPNPADLLPPPPPYRQPTFKPHTHACTAAP